MNSLRLIGVATTLLAACAYSLNAQSLQWQPLDGPEGGAVSSMARTPGGVIFAALGRDGLYRSDNGGEIWQRLAVQLPQRWPVLIHSTIQGTLLLSLPDSALLRSTDMGGTWQSVLPDIVWRALPVNDSAGGVIVADLHNLYRSTDDGASWDSLGEPFQDDINAIAVGSDGRLIVAVERRSSPRRVRISSDLGTTWEQFQVGDSNTSTIYSIGALPNGNLLVGTGGTGLLHSVDGGRTWVDISIERSLYHSAFAVLRDGSVVTATSRGLYRSTDGGSNWQVYADAHSYMPLTSLVVASGGRLLIGTQNSGVYSTLGDSLQRSSLGLPRLGISTLAVAPDGTIYTVANNGHLLASSDHGGSWSEHDSSRYAISPLAIDATGRLYASNPDYSEMGVRYTTNGGSSWTLSTSGIEREMLVSLQIDRNGYVYAGVERGLGVFHTSNTDGLHRSTDRGQTWTRLGVGLTGTSPQGIVVLDDGTLFVGSGQNARVYMLVPGDTLWRDMSSGLAPISGWTWLRDFIADSAENLYAATDRGLYRSSNRGASWERIAMADTAVQTLLTAPNGAIFAGTASQGCAVSYDNGITWRRLPNIPGAPGFQDLAMGSTGDLIAGTSGGLYRLSGASSVSFGDGIGRGEVMDLR